MCIGDVDLMTPMKQVDQIKGILEKMKEEVESEVVVYEGATHGFAVRGDRGNEKQKRQGLEAEDQLVNWFLRHFEKVS